MPCLHKTQHSDTINLSTRQLVNPSTKKNMPHNTANEIRRSFRALMNGIVSQNMRSYGSEYRINWGVSLMHLREMAAEYAPDSNVAQELWHDDVRESRIMALLLMPADKFNEETARAWMADLRTQEMAEMAASLLYAKLNYAPALAVDAMQDENMLIRILGYNLFARLVTNGFLPEETDVQKVARNIENEMHGNNLQAKHAAYSCAIKMEDADILADGVDWHNICQ